MLDPENASYILEQGKRLSESLLWRLQKSFFDSQGVQAWTTGIVPHYITSNGWIADAYAKVVLGWLRDCAGTVREPGSFAPLDLRHPVYIVELGCGSGRFGFHFFNRLLDLAEPLLAEPRAGPLRADRLHREKSRAAARSPRAPALDRGGDPRFRALRRRRGLERFGSNGPGWCSPPRRCAIRWW